MRYVSSREICSTLKISKTTLMNWRREGRVQSKQLSTKKILYDIDSIVKSTTDQEKRVFIYGRVSNTKQKPDLDRQVALLRDFVCSRGNIVTETITDVASGMNENRNGLQSLINKVTNNEVDEIVISYKDRLTRFGYGYFETFFAKFGVTITVVNVTKEEDFQTELTQDLISIIHHFSMKLYSNRRRKIVTDCKNQLKIEENSDSEIC